jgi:hypothetical protein
MRIWAFHLISIGGRTVEFTEMANLVIYCCCVNWYYQINYRFARIMADSFWTTRPTIFLASSLSLASEPITSDQQLCSGVVKLIDYGAMTLIAEVEVRYHLSEPLLYKWRKESRPLLHLKYCLGILQIYWNVVMMITIVFYYKPLPHIELEAKVWFLTSFRDWCMAHHFNFISWPYTSHAVFTLSSPTDPPG